MSHRGFMGGRKAGAPVDESIVCWLDATEANAFYDSAVGGSIVSTNGSPIGRWQDKSGNNNHFVNDTPAQRPVLETDGINSLRCVYFDGTHRWLKGLVDHPFINAADSVVVLYVGQSLDMTFKSRQQGFRIRQPAGISRLNSELAFDNTRQLHNWFRPSDNQNQSALTSASSIPYVMQVRARWSENSAQVVRNNATVVNNTMNYTGQSGAENSGNMQIGGLDFAEASTLYGYIGEVIVFRNASITLINDYQNDLINKWI